MHLLSVVLFLIGFTIFGYRRLLRYLHMLQQDDYNNNRFLNWMFTSRSIDKKLSLVVLGLGVLAFIFRNSDNSYLFIGAFGLVLLGWSFLETDPREAAKKKLVVTQRAKRILFVGLGFNVLVALLIVLFAPAFLWVLAIQAIPFLLCLGNISLRPYEANIQKGFREEAQAALASVNPKVISVTGSFGKTSVKHIVGHVFSLNTKTLMTPGSVNTEMGVSRILREELQPSCKYFVTEMGAYGIGSIARLCKFTPPDIGIITAIGAAHLERFGSLENTAKAKFELAEAVLAKPEGQMILHDSVMVYGDKFDFIQNNRDRVTVVGSSKDSDIVISRRSQTVDGLEIDLEYKGVTYSLFAVLFGEHHGDNMALAFATAVVVGLDPEKVVASLKSAPQIKHRLEVKKQPDGTVYIDDAFNSNPKGFEAAMGLMKKITPAGSKSILVTPGIVELGDEHDRVHTGLAVKAAELADVVLAVNPSRIPTFVGALSDDASTELVQFETFLEADAWLRANVTAGDVVLIENDLPDLFNDPLDI